MSSILLVEDHPSVAQVIAEILKSPTYHCVIARKLDEAYRYLQHKKPDLIIVDRGLPDGDGLELVKTLQSFKSEIPTLILSNKALTQDRIVGLRTGADDYLTKPFSIEELELRVQNLLKKTKNLDPTNIQAGSLHISTTTGHVTYENKNVVLRKRECEILSFLAKHKNQVMSRQQIIDHVWCGEEIPTYKSVDVYVRRIRCLLGSREKVIKTIRGFGYVLKESAHAIESSSQYR